MRVLLVALLLACGSEAGVQTTEVQSPSQPTPVEDPVDPRTPATEPDSQEAEPTPEPSTVDPSLACTRDDECTIGRGACNDEVPVRRDRAAEHEEQMARIRPTVDCADSDLVVSTIPQQTVAFCSRGICRVASAGQRCETTDDCVLVVGSCGMAAVTNRGAAAAQRAYFQQRGARITCSGHAHAPPIVPECRDTLCVGNDVGNPELRRGCRNANQCTVVRGTCGAWEVVSKRKEREAVRELEMRGALIDCEHVDPGPQPTPACINDYCVPAPS